MGNKLSELILIGLALTLALGWIFNLIALVKSDFKAPYGSEVARTIGVFMPPVGCVMG